MPGYCVQGTVGHKILSGQRKLEMEGRQIVSFINIFKWEELQVVGGDHVLVTGVHRVHWECPSNVFFGLNTEEFGSVCVFSEAAVRQSGCGFMKLRFVLPAAGGEDAGGVHVLQRPRRCQGHHAAHSPG